MEDFKQSNIEKNIYQYSSEWVKKLEDRQHWEFYWCQQKLMQRFVSYREENFLEIGVGSGFTANYCRNQGAKVTTLDIDPDKKPDIVANVVSYDFNQKYDHLMAFEILEHIPYDEFEKVVKKLRLFIKKYAFISIPRNERTVFSLNIKLPKIKPIELEWKILAGKITTENHHWELDYKGFSKERVERLFKESGLTIEGRLKYKNIHFYALGID